MIGTRQNWAHFFKLRTTPSTEMDRANKNVEASTSNLTKYCRGSFKPRLLQNKNLAPTPSQHTS